MGLLKAQAFSQTLRAWPREIWALLIHGPDDGAVSDHAETLLARFLPQTDPFNPLILSDDTPNLEGTLRGELSAIPMFGGRRIVWVRDVGKQTTKACQALLEQGSFPGFLLLTSQTLPKTSTLRTAFEKAPSALCLALYEETAMGLKAMVTDLVDQAGYTIEGSALEDFMALAGTQRALVREALERLLCYCDGTKTITAGDVRDVVSDEMSLSLDTLLDLAFLGKWELLQRALQRGAEQDLLGNRLVITLGYHVTRLKDLRGRLDEGQSLDQALRTSKPPVFFQRHGAIGQCLKVWSLRALASLEGRVFQTLHDIRALPALEQEFSERLLFAIAQKSRQKEEFST